MPCEGCWGLMWMGLSLFDMPMLISILFFFFKLFIYLGASGPSCSPWDPRCVLRVPSLWHAAFLVGLHRLQGTWDLSFSTRD